MIKYSSSRNHQKAHTIAGGIKYSYSLEFPKYQKRNLEMVPCFRHSTSNFPMSVLFQIFRKTYRSWSNTKGKNFMSRNLYYVLDQSKFYVSEIKLLMMTFRKSEGLHFLRSIFAPSTISLLKIQISITLLSCYFNFFLQNRII